jgi:hypothetical protein
MVAFEITFTLLECGGMIHLCNITLNLLQKEKHQRIKGQHDSSMKYVDRPLENTKLLLGLLTLDFKYKDNHPSFQSIT